MSSRPAGFSPSVLKTPAGLFWRITCRESLEDDRRVSGKVKRFHCCIVEQMIKKKGRDEAGKSRR